MIRERVPGVPVLALISMVAGGLAFVGGLSLPVYHNTALALRIKAAACRAGGPSAGQAWAQLHALESWRHPLMQGGLGAMACAALALVLWRRHGGVAGMEGRVFPAHNMSARNIRAKRDAPMLTGLALVLVWAGSICDAVLTTRRAPRCMGDNTVFVTIIGATILVSLMAGFTLCWAIATRPVRRATQHDPVTAEPSAPGRGRQVRGGAVSIVVICARVVAAACLVVAAACVTTSAFLAAAGFMLLGYLALQNL